MLVSMFASDTKLVTYSYGRVGSLTPRRKTKELSGKFLGHKQLLGCVYSGAFDAFYKFCFLLVFKVLAVLNPEFGEDNQCC